MKESEGLLANIIDYLQWRGDLSLERAPFNPVDALILSWLVSLPLGAGPLGTVGEAAAALDVSGENLRFAKLLSRALRFRDMELRDFVEKFSETEQMQFAAATILTGDGRAFIAFRGTDGTLVGWKEDFNMAFTDEVPAQREAVDYINRIGMDLKLPLRVGGHSKGGNLAVYGSAMCDPRVQRRIGVAFNFDGPGVSPNVMASAGYRMMADRIETFLPESSIVGILLERSPEYHVVASDARGAMQHDPLSWQVGPDGFVLLDSLGWESLYADRTIREWLGGMSLESRAIFVNALYDIVESTGAENISEIGQDWSGSIWRMLDAYRNLDLRTKAILSISLARLIGAAAKNITRRE